MARPATGTVFQKGGRWIARITLPDGTRRDVTLPRHYTEQQAKEKARELTAYVRQEGARLEVGEIPTIEKLTEKWHKLRDASPDLSASTKRQDRYVFKAHVIPALGKLQPDDCGTAVLRKFVRDLRAKSVVRGEDDDGNEVRGPIAPNTVRNIVGVTTQFFEDVIAEEWVDLPANPMKHPAVRKEVPEAETRAHAADVIVICSDAQVDALVACGLPIWSLRFVLALTTGLRDGEIAGLRFSDLDLEHEVPHIRVRTAIALTGPQGHATRGKLKTKNSKRPVPLHSLALELLTAWKESGWERYVTRIDKELDPKPQPDDPIFPTPTGKPHRPKSADMLRAVLRAAGLPDACDGHALDFHALRRTFATRLQIAGVPEDIRKRLMGHAASGVTGKHYTADDLRTLQRAVEATLTRVDDDALGEGDAAGVSSPVSSPSLSQPWDLNPRPAVYETAALPLS